MRRNGLSTSVTNPPESESVKVLHRGSSPGATPEGTRMFMLDLIDYCIFLHFLSPSHILEPWSEAWQNAARLQGSIRIIMDDLLQTKGVDILMSGNKHM